jgi:PTS system nitrogen regulatory IIA component
MNDDVDANCDAKRDHMRHPRVVGRRCGLFPPIAAGTAAAPWGMALTLSQVLHPDLVFPYVTATRKKDALAEVVAPVCARYPELEADRVTTALLARERRGTTALAEGIAIPHVLLNGLSRLVAAFGRSASGIDWDAPDGRPTDLFVLLLMPDDTPSDHLKLLAAVARLLRDPGCRMRLMRARAEDLLAVLRAEENHDRVRVAAGVYSSVPRKITLAIEK